MTAASTAEAGAGLSDEVKAEAARHGAGDAQAGLEKRDAKGVLAVTQAKKLDSGQKDALFDTYSHAYDSIAKREDLVDAASEMSFPASDPPSYMGGAAAVGAPEAEAPREKVSTTVSDPAEVKPVLDTNPEPGAKR